MIVNKVQQHNQHIGLHPDAGLPAGEATLTRRTHLDPRIDMKEMCLVIHIKKGSFSASEATTQVFLFNACFELLRAEQGAHSNKMLTVRQPQPLLTACSDRAEMGATTEGGTVPRPQAAGPRMLPLPHLVTAFNSWLQRCSLSCTSELLHTLLRLDMQLVSRLGAGRHPLFSRTLWQPGPLWRPGPHWALCLLAGSQSVRVARPRTGQP